MESREFVSSTEWPKQGAVTGAPVPSSSAFNSVSRLGPESSSDNHDASGIQAKADHRSEPRRSADSRAVRLFGLGVVLARAIPYSGRAFERAGHCFTRQPLVQLAWIALRCWSSPLAILRCLPQVSEIAAGYFGHDRSLDRTLRQLWTRHPHKCRLTHWQFLAPLRGAQLWRGKPGAALADSLVPGYFLLTLRGNAV